MCDTTKEPQFKSPIEGHSGIQIKRGDLLGYADNTGLSTGDHLHFGLKPVLSANEAPFTWTTVNPNNGYLGAIDPTPYLDLAFTPSQPPGRYIFNNNITLGSTSNDVMELQKKLQILGFFPATTAPTGYYGLITKAAVYNFQLKYVAVDAWSKIQVAINRGDAVRTLTLAALNKL